MSWRRTAYAAGAVLAAVLAMAGPAPSGMAAGAAPMQVDTGASVQNLYPKHVKSTVREIRVFTTPTGEGIWGYYTACTNFWVDRTDGDRYHLTIPGGYDAWVTSNPAYVAPGHC